MKISYPHESATETNPPAQCLGSAPPPEWSIRLPSPENKNYRITYITQYIKSHRGISNFPNQNNFYVQYIVF